MEAWDILLRELPLLLTIPSGNPGRDPDYYVREAHRQRPRDLRNVILARRPHTLESTLSAFQARILLHRCAHSLMRHEGLRLLNDQRFDHLQDHWPRLRSDEEGRLFERPRVRRARWNADEQMFFPRRHFGETEEEAINQYRIMHGLVREAKRRRT